MPGGLLSLLDDVSALARLAAASTDDVVSAASRAGTKTLGVIVDDTAVVPGYVAGLPPQRELPIIWKIAVGSLRNKLLFILPAAVLLSRLLPWALTPILMLGGLYLCFEGAEKVAAPMLGERKRSDIASIRDPVELEKRQVNSAIRTDLILSTEIMVIAINEVKQVSLWVEIVVLVMVGIAVTAGIYGVVALLVRMDDVGRWLAEKRGLRRTFGQLLLRAMPWLFKTLSIVGTAAMLWVGGGILIHGLAAFGVHRRAHWIHAAATALSSYPVEVWTGTALANGLVGLCAGGLVLAIVHVLATKKHA